MGTKEPLHPSTIIMKIEEVNETNEISRNGSIIIVKVKKTEEKLTKTSHGGYIRICTNK